MRCFCFEKYLARNDAAVELRVSAELRVASELRVLFVKSVHCFPPTALKKIKIAKLFKFSPLALKSHKKN